MKWKKLGKIFDPTEHKLSNNCVDFAQSPQVLLFDNFIRIYFSTRERDQKTGKYLSHISFVDFDKEFKKILKVSDKIVVKLGDIGCFDEHGIFPINILKDKNKILAYTCGWSRRVAVSVETSVGIAESFDDGLTFEKIGNGPILASSLNEPFLVGDAFVKKFYNVYHMWYIFGKNWIENINEPERVYKIGHAISDDGINWKKEEGKQIITDKLNNDECQALPTVIFHDNLYHMFFCFREAFGFRKNKNKSYKLGYAFSKDLNNWTRDDESIGINVSDNDWDSDMMCYPHLFKLDGKVYLLYNGNEFGRYGFGIAILED